MDLVNDLSTDVALAFLADGRLREKLVGQDAKSFIALLEAELNHISGAEAEPARKAALSVDLSH